MDPIYLKNNSYIVIRVYLEELSKEEDSIVTMVTLTMAIANGMMFNSI